MSVTELIARLRELPDTGRRYLCDERFGQLHLGLDSQLLRELAAAGLPCERGADGLRFEFGDLHYISLRLGFAKAFTWALRLWVSSLELFAAHRETSVSIAYMPQLTASTCGALGVARLPGGEQRRVPLAHGKPAVHAETAQVGAWPPLPQEAARVAGEIADGLAFCLLPAVLRGDVALARRTGLADCFTAALLIVEAWQEAGLAARLASGLLVSAPVSTLHSWPELLVDSIWTAADPMMIGVMRDFGGLDAARWPPTRSVGPMLARVSESPEPLLAVGADRVEATFLTKVLGHGSPARPRSPTAS